jgi:HPt (histidine-containing phosphotransfer) domain-containing protein
MNGFVSKPIEPEELWRALLGLVKVRVGLGVVAVPSGTMPEDLAETEGLRQALGRILTLDVQSGLARSMNNPKFYVSMLRKFVASQNEATQRIAESLGRGDSQTAERLAHTLKGLAGNMGASDLQLSAGQLEARLRDQGNEAEVQAALRETADVLERTMASIQGAQSVMLLQPEAEPRKFTEEDWQALTPLTLQIRALLQNDDATAADLWQANQSLFRAAYGSSEQIEAAIADFDFDAALELLDKTSVP